MVAYNFQEQFIAPIRNREKIHTIRGKRKRHARPGEPTQLYYAMRTKQCALIGVAKCVAVPPIEINISEQFGPLIWRLNGEDLNMSEMDRLAHNDGFKGGALQMAEWFFNQYGEHFEGFLIEWDPATLDTSG